MQTPAVPPASATARPAPVACLECRRKHLKCDGQTPVCRRCTEEAISCTYAASRRGYGVRTRPAKNARNKNVIPTAMAAASPSVSSNPGIASPTRNTASLHPASCHALPRTPMSPHAATTHQALSWNRLHLHKLYFTHFHPAHPLLVPLAFHQAQHYPEYLELVIDFTGQRCSPQHSRNHALDQAFWDCMHDSADEHTFHRVQALVLCAIVLHSLHQPEEAHDYISRAVAIAIQIGLNRSDFTTSHAPLSGVAQESMRRTWWELYTVDAYLAALHRLPCCLSDLTDSSLPVLPSSNDTDYERGNREMSPPTLACFEGRVFSAESRPEPFSPHCYRIEAIRLVRRVIGLSGSASITPDQIHNLDSAIAGWRYHLPVQHADFIESSGEVDPIFFQAHLFVHCASIFLHFPRSDLPMTVPSADDIACAKNHTQPLIPTCSQHTVKVIAASKELSSMAAVPWPVTKHSPLFICGLILAAIVQLAAASVHRHACGYDCLQQHRDRVVLLMGLLSRFGQQWTVAQHAHAKLCLVAATVFSPEDHDTTTPSTRSMHDSGVDFDELANVSWFDLFSADDWQPLQDSLLSFDSSIPPMA